MTMDASLSFLLFAALFYIMMRSGCGAHMIHGHHVGPVPTADLDLPRCLGSQELMPLSQDGDDGAPNASITVEPAPVRRLE
jgi:hypothetical protein